MKRTSFCTGWEFARGDGEFEPVVIPHDAMLGERRGPDAPAGSASGYYYGGVYHYWKDFELTASQASGALFLEFEGVYRDARIHVNGAAVEAPPYGFIPFFVDLTGLVRKGRNTIEVDARNDEQPDCRWYSGGGIHRPVWLWEGGAVRIAPEGVRVTTLSMSPTTVSVDVDCTGGTPEITILDADGRTAAIARGEHAEIYVPGAKYWSAEAPHLYQCVVNLRDNGSIVDTASVRFGIRKLEWSPRGLFVNGRETLLRGGCIHCDNGIIGAATFPESERRRIRMLKEAGFNAVRIAHNPAPSTILDACDELGMYVMDETWDTWFTRKSSYDYSEHFLEWCDHDLRRMVAHDYNHPSVIMYSIGNEVADPITSEGVKMEQSMVSLVHSLDTSRPVTCGLNLTMMVMEKIGRAWYANADGIAEAAGSSGAPRGSLLFNLAAQASGTGMTMLSNVPGADKLLSPALDALDIAGYNYAATRYAIDARKHHDRLIVGSETFPHKLPSNWRLVETIPNVIGDFMWAAWDYLGEAGSNAWAYSPEEAGFSKPWPWLFAGSGAFDALGQPSAHGALAGAVWGTADAPSIQVRPVNKMGGRTYRATWRGSDALPSWSWAGCEGTIARVEVYDGRAASVKLRLNGEDVGIARVRDYVAKIDAEYYPGTLTAIALDEGGREIGRSSLSTARPPFRLCARAEEATARAGGVAYIPVTIEGSNGIVESNADETLRAEVDGGHLLGFGSAQPAPTESFLTGEYTAYRGHALAIVHRASPGTARLTVRGETLAPTSIDIIFE